MKTLLFVYNPEDDLDNGMLHGINTFVFEANDIDIECLKLVDQDRVCYFGEVDDRPANVKTAWTFVLHNLASGCYESEKVFLREVDGEAFNEQELKILKAKDVGKWLKFREQGVNGCSDIERYYSIDLSSGF